MKLSSLKNRLVHLVEDYRHRLVEFRRKTLAYLVEVVARKAIGCHHGFRVLALHHARHERRVVFRVSDSLYDARSR